MKTREQDKHPKFHALSALPSIVLGGSRVTHTEGEAVMIGLSAQLGSALDCWCRKHLSDALGLSRHEIAKMRATAFFGARSIFPELSDTDDINRAILLGRALERARYARVALAA